MKIDVRGAKMKAKNGWLLCPVCGRGKILKIAPETRAESLVVYCRLCKSESLVNIDESLSSNACAT